MVAVDNPSLSSRLRMHLAWRVDAGEQLLNLICAALKPPATIVDIGCGGGALLAELTCRGYQAIGVERDPHSLALRDKRLTVLEGSAEILPLALRPGSCDGVVFSHVIEHLSDPVATLRSAAVLLKPTGLLFCEVPNNESLIARQSGLAWEHLDIPRHINFFNERSLVNVALSAGFKVNRTHFSGFCRVFSDSYIATEKRIFDQLENNNRISILAKRNSNIRSWSLLARTAFSDPREKYDSVGIIAILG